MDLPLIQGLAFATWAVENQPMEKTERSEPGYIAQQVARLRAANPPQLSA